MNATDSRARTTFRRKHLLTLLALPLAAGALLASPAHAEDSYPAKAIKLVVNFSAGGPIDVLARLVASKLGNTLKQSVYVENVSGAAGSLGAGNVARAEPDGYTVLISIDTPFTMNPSLYSSLPFKLDALKPVMIMGSSSSTIAVSPSSGIASLQDLIAKGKSGNVNFSSAGVGSPGHLGIAMFNDATGSHINHIPYRGNTPAVQAIVSNQVQGGILATPGVVSYVKSGKLKALAIAAPRHSVAMPDVPTTAELKYPNVELQYLFVAMVPSKTPDNVVQTLQKGITEALRQPDIEKRLHNLDMTISPVPDRKAADLLAQYRERYARIIKSTGMKVQ